jgi:hypothetical protein
METMETRNCQNCKQDFTIEAEDFGFYAKIKVPPPTFCPDCRRQRRFSFRNTHSLYKRKDSVSGKDMISIYSQDKDLNVVEQSYWWSDAWDAMDYGEAYDFSKPFFLQWKQLRDRIPLQNLSNSKSVNSEYCNVAEENYDCYMVMACFRNERVMYSDSVYYDKDSLDLHVVYNTEFSYDDVNCSESYKLFYSQDSHSCTDSYFLYDCKGCTNCFMSSNLRNKSYYFRNQQLTKEAYEAEMKKINLGSYATIKELKAECAQMKKNAIHKFASIINSYNVTGNNIDHSKNCKECFDVSKDTEDGKFMFWGGGKVRDGYDVDASAEFDQGYEVFDIGAGGSKGFFGSVVYYSSNTYYSFNCYGCNEVFGCFGLRNKSYCILNKQYTKEDYFALKEKIIDHMNTMPYVDKVGRVYRYGEFFPAEISPFCYNETVANDYFPLTKEEALQAGYAWKDKEVKNYTITRNAADIPDAILDITESIVQETIECEHSGKCADRCTTAFKILPNELTFYKRFGIPLPRLCYACRHRTRFNMRNPLKLWHRSCMCEQGSHGHEGKCVNEFETSYSPERPEIVYCEGCYQKEVV